MKNILNSLIVSLLFSLACSVSADDEVLEKVWDMGGFDNPESVIHDPQLDRLYVSNVNGGASDKDGNGYLSSVSMEGGFIHKEWITGLNAPKGLAIYGRTLYVADIDELLAIDIDSARVVRRYKVDDAVFLNDVTADQHGNIYVSDMFKDRIHILQDDTFSIWLASPALQSPNGLLVWGDYLILGSWGKRSEGFTTEEPGHLQRISLEHKHVTPISRGVGNLDGVEGDKDGDFYVTDWVNGKLFHIEHSGEVDTLLEFEQGSADLEFIAEQDMMFIPLMKENRLQAYKVHHR